MIRPVVPLFIIEEHHEAFAVWHHAAASGILKSADNVLAHLDDHADLSPPRLNRPLPAAGAPTAEVLDFARTELGIQNFIVAAAYRGLVSVCRWMRHSPVETSFEKEWLVRACDERGEVLACKTFRPDQLLLHPQARQLTVQFQTRYNAAFAAGLDILDIDLDFFSANIPPDHCDGRIEITEDEYRAFAENPYHFLRLHGPRAEARREEGRCYLVFNRFDHPFPADTRAAAPAIEERIDALAEFLRAEGARPRLIDVCRSRHSRYTPADQWEEIERRLLERLSALYPLEVIPLAALAGNPRPG